MANMNDVAKKAGVSKSTVSNVFSGKRPISQAVREKVLEAARELNYKPNYWARSMVTKQTRTIGLSMETEKVKFSQYNLSLFNGLLKECYNQGYRLLIDTLSEKHRQQVKHMTSEPIDGLVVLDPSNTDKRIRERLESGMKMVIIGKPPAQYESVLSYVNNDNIRAAETATSYLLSLGHRHILFINAVKKRTVSKDREAGFIQAYRNQALKFNEENIVYRDESVSSIEFGYLKTKEILKGPRPVTAVIADTDQVALGVYRAAAELGYAIPDDLSVIAFNNKTVYSDEFYPPLTSIHLNGEALGREAAKMLIELLQSEDAPVKQVIIPSKLEERSSCSRVRMQSLKEGSN